MKQRGQVNLSLSSRFVIELNCWNSWLTVVMYLSEAKGRNAKLNSHCQENIKGKSMQPCIPSRVTAFSNIMTQRATSEHDNIITIAP